MSSYSDGVLFSIIVPNYNGALYIEDCLDSILNQNYFNYEVLVIDDGSTDNSVDLVANYENKYKNIHLLQQQNSGTFNARLKGINCSHGDYLLFVDSDDLISTDALSILNTIIIRDHPDLLLYNCSNSINFDSFYYTYPFKDYEFFSEANKMNLYWLLCTGHSLNNLSTKCVNRELFHLIDLEPIERFCNAEDLYVSIKLIDVAKSVSFYNRPLYYYRINNNSSTHTYNEYYFISIVRANLLCIEYANKWDSKQLIKFAKIRACKSIIQSISRVINSNLSLEKCRAEIINIVNSHYYRDYIKCVPCGLSKKQVMLYFVSLNPFLITNIRMLKILRKLYK